MGLTFKADFTDAIEALNKVRNNKAKRAKALIRFGKKVKDSYKDGAKKYKDTGKTLKSIKDKFSGGGHSYKVKVWFANKYAYFAIEKGRGKGKRPPMKKILPWALRHGFSEQQAFFIAKKIGEQGVDHNRQVGSGTVKKAEGKFLNVLAKELLDTYKLD